MSKKSLNDRNHLLGIVHKSERVNFDLIDKTIMRLRFFKNFTPDIRKKLYEVAKYEIVPPNRVIAH